MHLKKIRIVVLISGYGSNLQALIDASHQGLAIDIVAVISNVANVEGLKRAELAAIPSHVIAHQDYFSAELFEQALLQHLDHYQPNLVVLAGFMRRLQGNLVKHYTGRMINIHPSLLPHYRGLNTHQRVIDAHETEHGASVHFVTAKLDAGPSICQARLNILPGDDAASLQQRVQRMEYKLYPKVLSWFAAGRVSLTSEQIILLDGKPLLTPIALTEANLLAQHSDNYHCKADIGRN